jgi:hypothetical protein|nr:MAG TPA: hypothetical protein [Caudoviricetes sp.]
MEKIFEHLNDVHVRACVAYGKTADKKLYYEVDYKTQVTKADMEDAFLKGLLVIDDGTNKLTPVAMTGATVTTVKMGTSAVEATTWTAAS